MGGGNIHYDHVLEYDDADGQYGSWKQIGQLSIRRKAHAVSVVSYDSVCPGPG